MEDKIRIQKILAQQNGVSRRAAEKLIEEGRVTVNGRPCGLGDKASPRRDLLAVDGVRVEPVVKGAFDYIVLYKPRGYVTTMNDEKGRRSVAQLVEDVGRRVYPVGRLDMASEGLLLMTNDGEFANRMMHPRYHVTKTYRVTLRAQVNERQLLQLEQGVRIDSGVTAPAKVRVLASGEGRTVLEMHIREGKNRQIRKMCEALGLELARLKRTAQGPVRLGMLGPGQWRPLTEQEITLLRQAADKKEGK